MTVKLAGSNAEGIVKAADMKDGQIGQIVRWASHEDYIGRIVQAYGNSVVSIGKPSGSGWNNKVDLPGYCLVRLLNVGELIEVVDN
jgi:hypothetical protein